MLTERRQIRLMGFLALLMYFGSYVTRINYAAIMVEVVASEGMLKTAASLVVTATTLSYGGGQLLSGWLGDKLNPRLLIFWGLVVTVGCNVTLPLVAPNPILMTALWGINGLAQAFLWPPLVRLLNAALSEQEYSRLAPKISLSASAATTAVYLVAPLLIELSGWRSVMWACGGFAAVVAVVWLTATGRLLRHLSWKEAAAPAEAPRPLPSHRRRHQVAISAAMAVLPLLMLAAALQGVHRDGVTTWIPTLLTETLHIPASRSILMVALLQAFPIVSSLLTYPLLRLFRENIYRCMAACNGFILLMVTTLAVINPDNGLVSILLLAPMNMAVHTVNTLQTVFAPRVFRGSPHLSLIAGGINFCVYVGSAVSAWLLPYLADGSGWTAVLWCWAALATVQGLVALLCAHRTKG
ncbi:MAG: MFS transporter [Ruminococcaceae bacterium]|nr:MFS transporter [Oscillospiraceae bacterium]